MGYNITFYPDTLNIDPPLNYREIGAVQAALHDLSDHPYLELIEDEQEETTERGVLNVVTCQRITPTYNATQGRYKDGWVLRELNAILEAVDPGHVFSGAIEVTGEERWDIRRLTVDYAPTPPHAVWEIAEIRWPGGSKASTRYPAGIHDIEPRESV